MYRYIWFLGTKVGDSYGSTNYNQQHVVHTQHVVIQGGILRAEH